VNDGAAAGDEPTSAEAGAPPFSFDDWAAHVAAGSPSDPEAQAPVEEEAFWGLAKKGVAGWGHEPSVDEIVSFWRALNDEAGAPGGEREAPDQVAEIPAQVRALMGVALRMPARGITTVRPGRIRTVPTARAMPAPKTETWLDFLPSAPVGATARGTSHWQPAAPAWDATPAPAARQAPPRALPAPPAARSHPLPASDEPVTGPPLPMGRPHAEPAAPVAGPPSPPRTSAGRSAWTEQSVEDAAPADASPLSGKVGRHALVEPDRVAEPAVAEVESADQPVSAAPAEAEPVSGDGPLGPSTVARAADEPTTGAPADTEAEPLVALSLVPEVPVAGEDADATGELPVVDEDATLETPIELTVVEAAETVDEAPAPAQAERPWRQVDHPEPGPAQSVQDRPASGLASAQAEHAVPPVEASAAARAVQPAPERPVPEQPVPVQPVQGQPAAAPAAAAPADRSEPPDELPAAARTKQPAPEQPAPEQAVDGVAAAGVGSPLVGLPVPPVEVSAPPAVTMPSPAGKVGLVGGGIAFADCLGVLERRRRAQQGYRQWGRQIALPVAPLDGDERQLRQGADPEGAAYLETALRAAAAGAGSEGLPPLRWVEASTDRVTMALTAPGRRPPQGFSVDGDLWVTTAPMDELTELAMPALAPVPALVPIGVTDDGCELLVDLESRRVTTVEGGHAEVSGLMRAVIVAASTASWCPQVRVLAVGLQPELAGLPGVEIVDTLDVALTLAESHARAVTMALSAIGGIPVTAARAQAMSSQAAETLLVVSARAPEDRHVWQRLEALRKDSASTVGVGLLVRHPGKAQAAIPTIEVDADGLGTVHLSNRGGRGVRRTATGRALDGVGARRLVALLETALRCDGGDVSVRPQGAETAATAEVVVRVLGDIEVVNRDGTPLPAPPATQEVLAYLGLQESTVSAGTLEVDMFPDGSHPMGAIDAAVAGAGGLVHRPAPARLAASERMVTDYSIFCGLVGWAVAITDPVEAARLLAEALRYVQAVPLGGAGLRYAWSGPRREAIVSHVVDAAESLAQLSAAKSDWPVVEWAVAQGLRAAPGSERLHCWRLRSAHAAGDIDLVHARFEELCDIVADPLIGVEPEATLHASSIALLEKLVARSLPEPQSVASGELHVLADRPGAATAEIPAVEVARALHGLHGVEGGGSSALSA
jgi:DNA-binding SARP family transcriptional activator